MRSEVPITALKVLAWLSLALGAVISVVSLVTLLSVSRTATELGLSGGIELTTLLLGFVAPFFFGALLWAFLMVVAIIAENVLYISDTTYSIAEAVYASAGWANGEEYEAGDEASYEEEAAAAAGRVRRVTR